MNCAVQSIAGAVVGALIEHVHIRAAGFVGGYEVGVEGVGVAEPVGRIPAIRGRSA